MNRQGYERDHPQHLEHPLAVRWWFVRSHAAGVFARGGRVRTARLARQAIYEAEQEFDRDAAVTDALRKIELRITPGGALVEVER